MTNQDEPDFWSPGEAERLRALAREPAPPEHLENRVVAALEDRGLLDKRQTRAGGRGLRLLAAAAAAVTLLVGGYLTGYRSGTVHTVSLAATLQSASAEDRAALVQRTGSEHVAALAALAELDPERTPVAASQGREAALVALYGSALELARMEPENESVLRILRVLAESVDRRGGPPQQVIWF